MPDQDLWAALERHLDAAVDLRRLLHRQPDLSGEESATRDLVLDHLPRDSEPIMVAESGAVVRIGPEGPAVGVRGEMDALPVHEKTGADWASTRPGVMHACGHDLHLAALVAVSRTVHEVGGEVPLLAVLQPREETYPSGAKDIADDGVLDREQCQHMVGVHIQPALPAGVVACVPGGVNASSDEFEIIVHGRSGHAAYPHLTDDPLLTLAEIVVALQSIVSRSVDPMCAAVVGVSSFRSGDAANIVPGDARATGTIRALNPVTRQLLHDRIRHRVEHVARAHGCEAEIHLTVGEPVLENDPRLVSSVVDQLVGRGIPVSRDLRSLGADDFSFFSERMPSTMMFVGSESSGALHSPSFLPTDDDLRLVARSMLAGYLGAARLMRQAPAPQSAPARPVS